MCVTFFHKPTERWLTSFGVGYHDHGCATAIRNGEPHRCAERDPDTQCGRHKRPGDTVIITAPLPWTKGQFASYRLGEVVDYDEYDNPLFDLEEARVKDHRGADAILRDARATYKARFDKYGSGVDTPYGRVYVEPDGYHELPLSHPVMQIHIRRGY